MKDKKEYNLDDRDVVILPITYDHGFRLNWVKFKRKLFKKRWHYTITIFFALIFISCGFLTAHVYYSGLYLNAATYGFLQSAWNEGASTTSTALHNNDQENYSYYYSKDDNIALLNNGEDISLTTSNSTITETTNSDFINGTITGNNILVAPLNDSLSLLPCNGTVHTINSKLYCLADSCLSYDACSAWYQSHFDVDNAFVPNCEEANALISSGQANSCALGILGNSAWESMTSNPSCTAAWNGICSDDSSWCDDYSLNCSWIVK